MGHIRSYPCVPLITSLFRLDWPFTKGSFVPVLSFFSGVFLASFCAGSQLKLSKSWPNTITNRPLFVHILANLVPSHSYFRFYPRTTDKWTLILCQFYDGRFIYGETAGLHEQLVNRGTQSDCSSLTARGGE